jgi:hypothetical protein
MCDLSPESRLAGDLNDRPLFEKAALITAEDFNEENSG